MRHSQKGLHKFLKIASLPCIAAASMLLQPVQAAQSFLNQRLDIYSSPGTLAETFILDITTEDTPTTASFPVGYTNPGIITPGGGTPDPGNPLLKSEPYKFTGYKIISLTGKRYAGNI